MLRALNDGPRRLQTRPPRKIATEPGSPGGGAHVGIFLAVLPSLALLIGWASYTSVYLAYNYVYADIEINPSEVGLDYIALLGRSPGAVIWVALIMLPILLFFIAQFRPLVVLVIVCTLLTYLVAVSIDQERQRIIEDERVSFASKWVIRVSQNVTGQIAQFSQNISETRRSLVSGDEVLPGKLFGVTVLDVTAVPSMLIWIDDPANSRLMQTRYMLGSGCVTYLGQSDRLSVIYSPETKFVARLPVDKVLIVRTRFTSVEKCSASVR